jgi:hypothetical protein
MVTGQKGGPNHPSSMGLTISHHFARHSLSDSRESRLARGKEDGKGNHSKTQTTRFWMVASNSGTSSVFAPRFLTNNISQKIIYFIPFSKRYKERLFYYDKVSLTKV